MKFKQFLLEQDPGGFDLSGLSGSMPGGATTPTPPTDMSGGMPPPMGGGDLGGPPDMGSGLGGAMGGPPDMGMGGGVDPNASQAPKKIKSLDVWEVLEKHICKKKK